MVEKIKKAKQKLRSPSAFTILFVVIIVMAALTWVVPSGLYKKYLRRSALRLSRKVLHFSNNKSSIKITSYLNIVCIILYSINLLSKISLPSGRLIIY